jgi:signal transduction histidine kinase/CheY-like chemotaxis protein
VASPWKALVAGSLTTGLLLGGAFWFSAREVAARRQELDRDTRIVALQTASRIHGAVERHVVGLRQMANFWEHSEEVTEEEFAEFAASTMRVTPLCLRIAAIDPSLHLRWVYPVEPNRAMVGFDVRNHALGHQTLQRARDSRAPVLSPPLELLDGSAGFAVIAPIYRREGFLGAVAASFRTAEFFGAVVVPQVVDRYEETVLDAGTPVFQTDAYDAAAAGKFAAKEAFDLGGRTWEIRVSPRNEVVAARLEAGQAAFWMLAPLVALGGGVLAGGGVLCATRTAQRPRAQGNALQQTQQKLDGAVAQLLQAEKLTALGELVAGVAHEINNPLTSILGYGQLLLLQELPPEARRRLDLIVSEADRAGRIVRNLLAFARKQPPETKYLGPNGVIEKTLELKAYHFRSSQIEVTKDLDPELPRTMLDFHQMQQVLLNLLNNAEQAMAESGRGGRIRVSTRRVADRIELRVTDSGPGIPPGIQARIFEPFFTTKKEGKGTGLGLSLCFGIVREHQGVIRAESAPGEGGTFIVELPIVAEREAAPAAAGAAPAGKGLKILVVDDEASIQSFLVDLLSKLGHRVDTASDVPEALRKIAADGHDLVISDMKMPKGTGRDIYRAAADKDPALARRVVFTTGDGASEETERFLREKGNPILTKPFSIRDVDRVIGEVLRK